MKSFKVADGIPEPKAYLVAGLPRPQNVHGPSENSLARVDKRDATLNPEIDQPSIAPRSTTYLDSAGNPDLVVFHPSQQFLTAPYTEDLFPEDVVSMSRTAAGLLELQLSPAVNAFGRKDQAGPLDLENSRIATFDKSVVIAGLDRARFASTDALFASAAISMDMSVTVGKRLLPSGRMEVIHRYWYWEAKNSVPVDAPVLKVFVELTRRASVTNASGPVLDQTDLFCAATAIVYDSPMYTTIPESYGALKSGLKLMEYGPIRNRAVLLERASKPPSEASDTPAVGSNDGIEAQIDAKSAKPRSYHPETPSDSIQQRLRDLSDDPEKLAQFVELVLSDDLRYSDDERETVLKEAAALAVVLQKDDIWHYDIMATTWQILGHGDENEQELAASALGKWGRWPEDASDDVLFDLPEEPDNPSLLRAYRIYLEMAGLDPLEISNEMNKVNSGEELPSRERIERLSGR